LGGLAAVVWFWVGLGILCSVPLGLGAGLLGLHFYLRWKYLHLVVRIFQEKPLFIVPRGQPRADAEQVRFRTADGLTLFGCYLSTRRPRRGVILFGLEFGSDCWSCRSYCEHLVDGGFDVFAFESRNQGSSERQPGYEPLQWVTDYEVEDVRAALRYLKGRPDATPPCTPPGSGGAGGGGVGFFGISKGGSAGLLAAAGDPYVRCCVTDGAFATYTTLVPYMRQWYRIYNDHYFMQEMLPPWYYGVIGLAGLRQIERERRCHFPHLEKALRRLAPRPLLMIHGGGDTYIKPDMARALFDRARAPKEFWLVEGAKHNQALPVAGDEYRRRVLEFFERHLASEEDSPPGHRGHKEDMNVKVNPAAVL
jgi:alpha-beta hydrolase superfamily lysophospholipase